MAYSRSLSCSVLGQPAFVQNGDTYYHAFRRQDVVFGPTRYCRFSQHGGSFYGKIHSCWRDGKTRKVMAEVQPFVYAGADARDVGEDYPELRMVVGGTVEVEVRKIKAVDVRLLHVPHDIVDIASYVEANIGTEEYGDDDEEEEDKDNFIVHGEEWGWYQLTDDGRFAPPPQFVDKVMAYSADTLDGDAWFEHEACYYILGRYFRDPWFENQELNLRDVFCQLDKNVVPDTMDPALAQRCSRFMAELRPLLCPQEEGGGVDVYAVFMLCQTYSS